LIAYTREEVIKEAIIISAVCLLEFIRIHLGRKGSLSDHGYQVWLSVLLILPVSAGVIYLIGFQINVLKLEYILCALMLLLHLTELIFAVLFFFSLFKTPTYD
jgi:transmembrane protein 216